MTLSKQDAVGRSERTDAAHLAPWRAIARHAYNVCLAAAGLVLIFVSRPTFDLHPPTLAAVAFIAVFLAVMEKPTQAAGLSAAPMTSVMGASAIIFGWWTLVLAVIGWGAVHLRAPHPTLANRLTGFLGQVGAGFIAVYAMVSTWQVAHGIALRSIPPVSVVVTLVGTLVVAALWQTINNTAIYPALLIAGHRVPWLRLFRVGILAALYAYLFVALYNFGGLLAAALLYVVLAQHQTVDHVVGVTAALQKLDRAREQARNLAADLMRFRDTNTMRLASEVQSIAQRIGRRLGMSRTEIAMLGLAAELHEIGMARLPPSIRQNANLNSLEQEQLKTFPRIGAHMIREADALLPNEIAGWIEAQSEHFDGGGYPRGLSGDEIPVQSRIIALARDYVRLISGDQSEGHGGKEKALAILRERAGIVYDPKLLSTLSEVV